MLFSLGRIGLDELQELVGSLGALLDGTVRVGVVHSGGSVNNRGVPVAQSRREYLVRQLARRG